MFNEVRDPLISIFAVNVQKETKGDKRRQRETTGDRKKHVETEGDKRR